MVDRDNGKFTQEKSRELSDITNFTNLSKISMLRTFNKGDNYADSSGRNTVKFIK